MCRNIFLDAPNVGGLEKEYLNKAIDTGFVSTVGPFVPEFEEKLAEFLGIEKAVSTQSGTSALHVALRELGIEEKDEVIVPALTFVATVNPILYVGAKPVFVDVDIKSWNIDPGEIEKHITKNTKAIIPVHLFGNPCDMDVIMDIARKHELYVIEDATESLGAKYKGKYTGTFGDLGCLSFNGNKIITTGGGGMVMGSDPERLDHVKFLVNQSRDESKGYFHPEVGFNYRMTNIEAAMGLAQMEKLEGFLAKKRTFNKIYKEELNDLEFISFQAECEGAESCWWLTCIFFENEMDIAGLQEKLKTYGIPTRRVFVPATDFPPYKDYKEAELPNSFSIYERGLCLPCSTRNSEDDIYYVCEKFKKLVSKN